MKIFKQKNAAIIYSLLLSYTAFFPSISAASALTEKVQALENQGWSIGVTVLDTGSNTMESVNGDTRFHFNSTIKALACANVLAKVDKAQLSLEDSIQLSVNDIVEYSPVTQDYIGQDLTLRKACEAALTYSDNTAANYTISSVGGPAGLTEFMRSIGDDVLRSDRYEPELTENVEYDIRDTTSTNAMATSLKALLLGDVLRQDSKYQLKEWMIGNRVADTLLRASLPKGLEWPVFH
ncbi:class A beta-lactamase [Vibrio fluvialis]